MEEFTINVQVAQRVYPIKIKREDEEKVRKAAKMINDRIKEYEKEYAVNDKHDLLAMCALQIASALVEKESESTTASAEITDQIQLIEKSINGLLV